MQTTISITGMGSISPLGSCEEDLWQSYLSNTPFFEGFTLGTEKLPIGRITSESLAKITLLQEENPKYKSLDPSVLYAIYASREALRQAGWNNEKDFGVNIGSSRGATTLLEEAHKNYLEQGKCSPLASPTTSLGNIASWVMQDAKGQGMALSHSITCSTALHAIINAIAWLKAGMAKGFLAGGSEAPLTPFTLAQMKALKVYGSLSDNYPSQPLSWKKNHNTMVLGEGAAVFALEEGFRPNAIALIQGIGYATERIQHPVAISDEGTALQESMRQALEGISPSEVDVIIPHATGTLKGDLSEYHAIKEVFRENIPLLTSNKWKIGHTFAASGALALQMAILMLQKQTFLPIPYLESLPERPLRKILINATGFGGNATSILIGISESS